VSGPAIGELIFKATSLAVLSGAPEIDIDTLLAALDASEEDLLSRISPPEEATGSGSYAYYVNSD
jgi:hypothetical protein